MGNTPQWGVAHPPGGQRPISLEYQIYLPAIDTIVTGMANDAVNVADVNANDTVLDVNDVLHLSMNNRIKASMLLAS